LREANIDYEPEKVFVWSKFKGNRHFRYDFYMKSKNMIVEIMGGQHYGVNDGWFGNCDRILKTDVEKEKLAKLHGVVNYIKIDCRASETSFMKKSIIKEMKGFYDLKDLNWKNIKSNSLKSKVIEVCEYYNLHNDISIVKLASFFNVSRETISKYLKRGNDVGICNYVPLHSSINRVINKGTSTKEDLQKDILLISKYYNENPKRSISEICFEFNMNRELVIFCLLNGNKSNLCVFPEYKHLDKKILQFTDSGKFIDSFDTVESAAERFNVHKTTISKACNGKILICKNYIFRNNKVSTINKNIEVSQYTLSGKLLKTFSSVADARRDTGITTIHDNLKGRLKTAGGFVWKRCVKN
jgi:hypothetical protein